MLYSKLTEEQKAALDIYVEGLSKGNIYTLGASVDLVSSAGYERFYNEANDDPEVPDLELPTEMKSEYVVVEYVTDSVIYCADLEELLETLYAIAELTLNVDSSFLLDGTIPWISDSNSSNKQSLSDDPLSELARSLQEIGMERKEEQDLILFQKDRVLLGIENQLEPPEASVFMTDDSGELIEDSGEFFVFEGNIVPILVDKIKERLKR